MHQLISKYAALLYLFGIFRADAGRVLVWCVSRQVKKIAIDKYSISTSTDWRRCIISEKFWPWPCMWPKCPMIIFTSVLNMFNVPIFWYVYPEMQLNGLFLVSGSAINGDFVEYDGIESWGGRATKWSRVEWCFRCPQKLFCIQKRPFLLKF